MKFKLVLFSLLGNLILTSASAQPAIAPNKCINHINELVQGNTLDLHRCGIDDMRFYEVMLFLEKNPQITVLNLSGNQLGDAAAKWIGSSNHYTRVNLAYNHVGLYGMFNLGSSRTITSLNISENDGALFIDGVSELNDSESIKEINVYRHYQPITNNIAYQLAQNKRLTSLTMNGSFDQKTLTAIASNPNLTSLSLNSSNLTDDDVKILVSNHPHLKYLSLNENKITSAGASIIADNLKELEILDLSYNQIDDRGAQALATIRTLKQLDLASNKITDTGVQALNANPSITSLSLYSNYAISDQSAILLANNTHLKSLMLEFDYITNKGLVALAKNNSLNTLGFGGLKNMEDTRDSVAEALAQNTTLKNLDLVQIILTEKGFNALIETLSMTEVLLDQDHLSAFSKNRTLKELSLSDVLIGDKAGVLVAQMPLTTLDVYNAHFDIKTGTALTQNPTLKNLYLVDYIGRDNANQLIASPTLLRFHSFLYETSTVASANKKKHPKLFCQYLINPKTCERLI